MLINVGYEMIFQFCLMNVVRSEKYLLILTMRDWGRTKESQETSSQQDGRRTKGRKIICRNKSKSKVKGQKKGKGKGKANRKR